MWTRTAMTACQNGGRAAPSTGAAEAGPLAFIAHAIFLDGADISCLLAVVIVLWWLWFTARWAEAEGRGGRHGRHFIQ